MRAGAPWRAHAPCFGARRPLGEMQALMTFVISSTTRLVGGRVMAAFAAEGLAGLRPISVTINQAAADRR